MHGDILNHEYMVKEGRKKVADTYSVGIDPGQNDILILAVAVAIDMLVHDDDDKKKKKER